METVRPYAPADRHACLDLFDGNAPRFFALSERADFAAYLDGLALTDFLVIERDGRIVGCGGHLLDLEARSAGLAWGMVAREEHGAGLGSRLLRARLDRIRAVATVARVSLDTSQHTKGFYARFGFRPVGRQPDGYGPGLDRWDMVLDLDHSSAQP